MLRHLRSVWRKWLVRQLHNLAIRCALRGNAKWIHLNGGLYIERYMLRGGFDQDGDKINVWLHRFHQPDDDRGPHNHPHKWNLSLILVGGYLETLVVNHKPNIYFDEDLNEYVEGCSGGGTEIRGYAPGHLNFIGASDFHRISDLLPCPDTNEVWTLFIAGPKHGRSWGYLIDWIFKTKKCEGGCRGCRWGTYRCDASKDLDLEIDTSDFDELTPVRTPRLSMFNAAE